MSRENKAGKFPETEALGDEARISHSVSQSVSHISVQNIERHLSGMIMPSMTSLHRQTGDPGAGQGMCKVDSPGHARERGRPRKLEEDEGEKLALAAIFTPIELGLF